MNPNVHDITNTTYYLLTLQNHFTEGFEFELCKLSNLIAVHISVRIEFINSICLVHHVKVVWMTACDELDGQTSWLEAAAVRPGVI